MYFKQVFSKIPKNEMKFIHVSREKLSFSFYNKPLTKSSSEIKLFFFKKVNTYVRKILANTFIRNFSPYPEAVMESVSIRKSSRKVLERF